MLHMDAICGSHRAYPDFGNSHFQDPVTQPIDDERQEYFKGSGMSLSRVFQHKNYTIRYLSYQYESIHKLFL